MVAVRGWTDFVDVSLVKLVVAGAVVAVLQMLPTGRAKGCTNACVVVVAVDRIATTVTRNRKS